MEQRGREKCRESVEDSAKARTLKNAKVKTPDLTPDLLNKNSKIKGKNA